MSANKDTNLIMHGVNILVQEKLKEVDVCQKDNQWTYWVFSIEKYMYMTPERKTVSKLLFKRRLKLSKAKYTYSLRDYQEAPRARERMEPHWSLWTPKTL